MIVHNFDSLYDSCGKFDEAEKILLLALAGIKKRLSRIYRHTRCGEESRHSVYRRCGKLNKTENVYEFWWAMRRSWGSSTQAQDCALPWHAVSQQRYAQ